MSPVKPTVRVACSGHFRPFESGEECFVTVLEVQKGMKVEYEDMSDMMA